MKITFGPIGAAHQQQTGDGGRLFLVVRKTEEQGWGNVAGNGVRDARRVFIENSGQAVRETEPSQAAHVAAERGQPGRQMWMAKDARPCQRCTLPFAFAQINIGASRQQFFDGGLGA